MSAIAATSTWEQALRHIRDHITDETGKSIACWMMHRRLDYCNSLVYGCESEQATTSSELCRASRNKNQTLWPHKADRCRTTLVAGDVLSNVQGRQCRSISAGLMCSNFPHQSTTCSSLTTAQWCLAVLLIILTPTWVPWTLAFQLFARPARHVLSAIWLYAWLARHNNLNR